jgi:hypothetical protein
VASTRGTAAVLEALEGDAAAGAKKKKKKQEMQ